MVVAGIEVFCSKMLIASNWVSLARGLAASQYTDAFALEAEGACSEPECNRIAADAIFLVTLYTKRWVYSKIGFRLENSNGVLSI